MLTFDFNNMTDSALGAKEGIDIDKLLSSQLTLNHQAFYSVINNRGKDWQEWCNLPNIDKKELDEIINYTNTIRQKATDFIVLGIGGSALGPLAVANALMHQKHNLLSKEVSKAPRLFVEDNIDPLRMTSLLDVIDIQNSYFNVITKSGETSETLAQFLILYDILCKKLGKAIAKERIIITTTIGKGALYETAKTQGFKIYGIGVGVGGRFSVLSPVGLITLGVMGIDIKQLLQGAKDMTARTLDTNFAKNPAFLSAILQVESIKKGKNISVLMPYSDSLKYMADFYCQLWGESLGKALDKDGNTVNIGQTPVKSLGVTDQHSQVQLYTEGPFDKVVTFLSVQDFCQDITIPKLDLVAGAFLADCTMSKLLNAERIATEFALTKAQRANFTIIFPKIDAYSVGELLSYFMYQTAFAGALLNVDTFNQPGVEEGKLATFAMIGRKGYESKLQEINSQPKNSQWII